MTRGPAPLATRPPGATRRRMPPRPGLRGAGRGAAFAVLATFAVVLLGPMPTASAATTLQVEVGYAGRHQPGRDVPVRVRLTSDRLIRGQLEVAPSAGNPLGTVSVSVPVEAAGGSVSEIVVVLPNVPFGAELSVDATLRVGGKDVADGTGKANASVGDEIVGLLPGALGPDDPPSSVPLSIDAGVARFVAVSEADLAAGPGALGPLDVLGATGTDLTGLDARTLAGVRRWVEQGGTLLVDSEPGAAVPGLPAEWRPGPTGRVAVGQGEVRAVGTAMDDGRWVGLIEPTPLGVSQQNGFSGEPIEMSLARDAGLQFPRLNGLLAFLAVYGLVLVPVTMFVLRRRGRGELAWVVLPVLALLCTGGAYAAGRSIRDDTRSVHASVLETGTSPWVQTTVGLVSRAGGTEAAHFPRGWSPTAGSTFRFGPPKAVEGILDSRGLTTEQDLAAGEFALRSAAGPAQVDGALVVEGKATSNDHLEGTVRNTLPFALQDVAVFQDRSGVLVGKLDAGEQRTWKMDLDDGGINVFQPPADRVWATASGMNGRFDRNSIVNLGMWSSFLTTTPSGLADEGTLVAAGWTRRFQPDVSVRGSAPTGRTVVVGSAPVGFTGGPVTGPAVASAVVRSPFTNTGAINVNDPTTIRFTLPNGADGRPVHPARLVLRGPTGGSKYEAWVGGRWTEMPEVDGTEGVANGPMPAPADFTIPAGAVQGGRFWVRMKGGANQPFVGNPSMVTMSVEER